jgi:hypothetical protein
LTFCVPIWAANAAPVRPAKTLAQHRDADPVDDEDHGAELPRDETDLEGDDHSHQEADEQHDGHGIGAGLGGDRQHLAPADQAAMPDGLEQRRAAIAEKGEKSFQVRELLGGSLADLRNDSERW